MQKWKIYWSYSVREEKSKTIAGQLMQHHGAGAAVGEIIARGKRYQTVAECAESPGSLSVSLSLFFVVFLIISFLFFQLYV